MILYFSDNYTYDVMGTKRSLFEEVKRRCIPIKWFDKRSIVNVEQLVEENEADQIWLAHSGLGLPLSVRKRLKCIVIGFGFSDPYYFKPARLESYDMYVTNHMRTYEKFCGKIPIFYNPTACDVSFHENLDLPKTLDISIVGCGRHPRFKNKMERCEILNTLCNTMPNKKIMAYGRRWIKTPNTAPHISGNTFLKIICSSKIGLDIQEEYSPLAHRMFEYLACGTPIITRKRAEVFDFLEDGKEIITYSTHAELFELIAYYLDNLDELNKIANAGYVKARAENSVINRVDNLVKNLGLI